WTSSLARSTALRPMYATRLALAVFMGIPRGAGAPEDDSHLYDTSFESARCSRSLYGWSGRDARCGSSPAGAKKQGENKALHGSPPKFQGAACARKPGLTSDRCHDALRRGLELRNDTTKAARY